MATEILVDRQIEGGRRLLAALQADRFDVTVAFWAKTGDEGRWFLYVASKLVDQIGSSKAYSRALAVLQSIPDLPFGIFDFKLLAVTNSIAKDVLAFRNRFSTSMLIHVGLFEFGSLAVQEAYIYGSA
jgi:hypothetical protein